MATISFQSRKEDWCKIIAFAWMNPDVLSKLRKDPKGAIEELSQSSNEVVKEAATNIRNEAEDNPLEDYSGYLPIPKPFAGYEKIPKEPDVLKSLIQAGGLSGVLQCNRNSEAWANILRFAWSDSNNLKNIRQNPLDYLPESDKNVLLNDDYGLFPLPDRFDGLNWGDETFENLIEFLGAQDAEYITGIWLMCT